MRTNRASYLCWALGLFGFCGIHRFYNGRPLTGLLWLFTLGFFWIGQIVDLFLIPAMVERANTHERLDRLEGRPVRV